MQAFQDVVDQLQLLAEAMIRQEPPPRGVMSLPHALNGGPSASLRKLVSISDLRNAGAFFTGHVMADRLVAELLDVLPECDLIVDPACGAGDLLLACARQIPIERTLSATLGRWGRILAGFDISPEFVHAARVRLVLQAIARGVEIDAPVDLDSVLPQIQVRDALTEAWGLPDVSMLCVVLNPPYITTASEPGCLWGRGKVSQAAVFVDRCLDAVPDGSTIAAILPDVLRSGSRYEKWRRTIAAKTEERSSTVGDQFDSLTDVHVYTVVLSRHSGIEHHEAEPTVPPVDGVERNSIVSDEFAVNVGAVVPHRDPEIGPVLPYIHARSVPRWATLLSIEERRAFGGRTFAPPFVVVRRTSRPEDAYRAVGAVVTGKKPIAVENHLLVLTPKSRLMADCYRLLDNLRSNQTNAWLNLQIRCRHLTVRALRNLPLWDVE